ncbi:MAG: hypothetical protein ACFB50_04800 [Rubrobacteraceae bacterium]
MFGRKSRAEKLKEQADERSFIPVAALATFFSEARPVAERLLYDDELRDNLRTFIEAVNKVYGEVSGDSPGKIVARLWDDDSLREPIESATAAVQEGSRRVRGEKVKSRGGGGGSGLIFLLLAAAVGFLFLNPKTGPQARKLAQDAVNALNSSG